MRVTWWAYGLVRPVVRPALRRLRMFFVGRLHDEIAVLRTEVARCRDEVADLHSALERVNAEREVATAVRVQAVMADALATLALDRERDPRV